MNLPFELSEREVLIILVSRQIQLIREKVDSEANYPGHDPDKSDDLIKKGQKDHAELSEIRTKLERILFGPLWENNQ